MRLLVLTAAEAAFESGLAATGGLEPSFRGIARFLRATIALKGGLRIDDLLDRAVTEAEMVGIKPAAAKARALATLSVLEAAGDLAVIRSAEARMVVSPPEQTIRLSESSGFTIGGAESEWIVSEDGADGSILRTAADISGARNFDDYLGPPGYRTVLRNAGLPDHVDLGLAASLLAVAARTAGNPVEGSATTVWGRLQDDIAFGAIADGREAVFAFAEDGSAKAIIGDDIACWMAVCIHGIDLISGWSLPRPMPRQLLRALAALGQPVDDRLLQWKIDEDACERISAWAGIPAWEDARPRPDPDQDAIVNATPEARILVEAPPGSGKTWVACRRVSSLVEQGVSPARIWMVSFTRTAVAEMRSRIAAFLNDPSRAQDVRIVTIDSLAWRLTKGFTEPDDTSTAGHDVGIQETLSMLRNGDVQLLDFIHGIEHVIVDEAQDLVGDRCRLIAELVTMLSSGCGVTVFGDPAQAIYGFSDVPASLPLANRLADDPSLRFVVRSLGTDHRTKDPALSDLFSRTRSFATRTDIEPAERYKAIRAAIDEMADLSPTNGKGGSDTLILFRSRAEMLVASSELWASRSEFRVRFTARQEIVQPWVGALLVSCRSSNLERKHFDNLWMQLRPAPLLPRDEAWSLLRRMAAAGNAAIDLRRLAARLSTQPPPIEVQQTDLGPPTGPLLTTIHGAKGREAEEVRLMLSRHPENEPSGGWDEEARILFVGATRARSRLVIGSSGAFLRRQEGTGRRWQRWARGGRNDARIEIGLDGDVESSPPSMSEDGTNDIQNLLWRHSWRPLALRAERQEGTYILKADEGSDEGRSVGVLTTAFSRSLRNLAGEANGAGTYLPRHIRGFHMVSARTVSLLNGTDEPRFWLSPVIAGLPVVYLNGGRQSGDS
ncbi:UvrD-helicase domain-containing protein [Sandaracinobacteroides hominis]|uniref:UvrD-helicase domain-containing protein n=1 Tax=Sandaracinobacteroides hominis TaxID=2780086 RepID=UPI0018F6A86F|nr:UvrD-helicase domain-containing protein [Sandaracinobacteroides hominis]